MIALTELHSSILLWVVDKEVGLNLASNLSCKTVNSAKPMHS